MSLIKGFFILSLGSKNFCIHSRCCGTRIRVEMSSGRSRRDNRRRGGTSSGGRGGAGEGSSGGRGGGGRYRYVFFSFMTLQVIYKYFFYLYSHVIYFINVNNIKPILIYIFAFKNLRVNI